jgi:ribosomal protein L31E
MANIERTYTIPLRREWLKSVKYKRAKKAVRAIREFLMRHMKVEEMDNIKLGKYLNLILWSHGIKNPPSRVKVNVIKDDKGIVRAEIVGAPVEKKKEEKPKKGAKPGEKKPEAPARAGASADQPTKSALPEKKAEPAKPAEAKPAEAKPVAPKPAVPKAPSAPQPVPVKPAPMPAPKQQTGQMVR